MTDDHETERLRRRISVLEEQLARALRAGEACACPAPEGPSLEARRGELMEVSFVEQETLLAAVERTARMGSWTWDLAGDHVSWSRELYDIFGYDPRLDAPSVDAFFQRIHPDDVDRVKRESAQGASSGESRPTEYRIVLPSGEEREVVMDGVAIRWEGGRPARFVGTVLDVTARRAAERELRRSEAFLNEAQRIAKIGSFLWERSTGRVIWSDELYRLTGLERGSPVDLETMAQLVHKDDRARAVASARSAADTGEAAPEDVRVVRRRDGAIRDVHIAARPVRRSDGELDGFLGTAVDVTDRKLLEEQLRQSQKMEALGRLAGGVAHDFNNLLTVIEGYTQILLREAPREELEQIAAASAAAADLTRRLLAFSRQAMIEPVVLDLNESVESAVKLISRVIGEDIRVALELAPDAWKIRADPSQVHQILLNLTLNARDAMPDGGKIVIRTRNTMFDERAQLESGGSSPYVALEVSDTGTGMDEETKARVFEPFFTTKAPGKGTGLGLATVFAIIRRTGGHIDVASTPGAGTTFKLYFPQTLEPAPEPRKKSAYPPMRGSEGILIVEDNPAVRRLITRVLEEAGYRVYAASLPSQARSLWRTSQSDISLLITDVVMPEQSGRELARELREASGRALRVLYITGHVPERQPGDDTPLDAPYLPKPFTPARLLSQVRRALQR